MNIGEPLLDLIGPGVEAFAWLLACRLLFGCPYVSLLRAVLTLNSDVLSR